MDIELILKQAEENMLAAMAYSRKHLGLAVFLYSEAIKAISSSGDNVFSSYDIINVYVARGIAYTELDEWSLAEDDFSRAIELEPNNITHYIRRGQVRAKQGGILEEAIGDFTAAIELDDICAASYIERGKARAQQITQISFESSYASDEKSEYQSLSAGEIKIKRRIFKEALSDFKKAICLEPGNSEAYICLGDLYAKEGKYSTAIKHLTRAIRTASSPEMKERAYTSRAMVYGLKGDEVKSRRDINKMSALSRSSRCSIM